MTRPSLREFFDRARTYLDTDDLNFPDPLCNMLTRRIWYQAVVMEREWRFFQRKGTTDVVAGQALVPMSFDTAAVILPATRLMAVVWNQPLIWREAGTLVREFAGQGSGEPVYWTELNDGLQRNIALFPRPGVDGVLSVEFYQEPVYPEDAAPDPAFPFTVGFVDLPAEFDDALLEGLLGEMYMREEDPDLYDLHRQTFLEQMGSIRNRWRESNTTPMVVAGRALLPGKDPGGFAASGAFTQPVGARVTPMANTIRRRSSSNKITYIVLNKFQGGISGQNDKVQIPLGFSPMSRNVEWQRAGGFYVRKGVGRLVYGAAGAEMIPPGAVPTAFYHYVRDPSATTQFTSQYILTVADGRLFVGVDYGVPLTTDGNWRVMQAGGTDVLKVGEPSITAWDTKVYISLGSETTNGVGLSMHSWDGTTCTALGKVFADDYAAPTGGNMPAGRYVANWAERMWVGCTLPDTGIEASMIRWSHPGRPEDWATPDYIRVGQAGDVITGIAPMRDMLVIFKRSSMYALLGSGATNFRVVSLSGTTGCTGEWTTDNQGRIVFWDSTQGLSRFDGKAIEQLFAPLAKFIEPGAGQAIHRCGGVVTDGDRIYAATDFIDFYGNRVPEPVVIPHDPRPRTAAPLIPGKTQWGQISGADVKWAATAGTRWMQASVEFYNIVWVYRENCGFTSFTLSHPSAKDITMLGQVRSRLAPTGAIESNRRIVYGLSSGTVPIYLSDRYDNGRDWWAPDDQDPIDAFYMTPWLHGGLPAQIKRFKAPRVIQEADEIGVLLIDVFYDFNYDFLRRTLKTGVLNPLSFDSYVVGKPGTIGRAKAVMLVIRPEEARHWGVSSITVPVHPKVMR